MQFKEWSFSASGRVLVLPKADLGSIPQHPIWSSKLIRSDIWVAEPRVASEHHRVYLLPNKLYNLVLINFAYHLPWVHCTMTIFVSTFIQIRIGIFKCPLIKGQRKYRVVSCLVHGQNWFNPWHHIMCMDRNSLWARSKSWDALPPKVIFLIKMITTLALIIFLIFWCLLMFTSSFKCLLCTNVHFIDEVVSNWTTILATCQVIY